MLVDDVYIFPVPADHKQQVYQLARNLRKALKELNSEVAVHPIRHDDSPEVVDKKKKASLHTDSVEANYRICFDDFFNYLKEHLNLAEYAIPGNSIRFDSKLLAAVIEPELIQPTKGNSLK